MDSSHISPFARHGFCGMKSDRWECHEQNNDNQARQRQHLEHDKNTRHTANHIDIHISSDASRICNQSGQQGHPKCHCCENKWDGKLHVGVRTLPKPNDSDRGTILHWWCLQNTWKRTSEYRTCHRHNLQHSNRHPLWQTTETLAGWCFTFSWKELNFSE